MIGLEADLIKRVAFWRHRTALWRSNYTRVLQENKRLKEELKRKHDPYRRGTKEQRWTRDTLLKFAEEQGIDLR